MTNTKWHSPAADFKATPVIPLSFILATLLTVSWCMTYFIWDYWQFAPAVKRIGTAELSIGTYTPAWDTATLTMQDGQPLDFKKAFAAQECVLLYAQHPQQMPIKLVKLCQKSVMYSAY